MTDQQGFPQIGARLTDPTTGSIQQAWLQLLIQLWQRTGAGPGVSSVTLEAEIVAISEQLAQITVLALAEPSAAGLAQLAGAVDALTVQGLQRPFFQACCDEAEIAGLARSLFAAALMVARSISMTGDGTWSVEFDGSDDVTGAMTLATVNADVGTFGDATHVAQVTVNAKGLVTAVTEVAISGGGGGGLDELTGDVTAGPGTGSQVATIPNGTVTYAKMQDVSATSRVLGRRTAGSGDVEECTLSQVLDFVGSAAQGDLLFRDASGWARLGAGTAGQVLQTGGAGANPSWAASGAGALTFVGRTTVAGAAASTITVGSLDLDTDGRYLVIYNVRNNTNTAANISLFYNADTTATNYNRQSLTADGATVSSGRVNNGQVGGMSGNAASTGSGDSIGELLILKNQSGRPMAMSHHGRSGVSHVLVQMWTHQWNTAGTNVTGITLSSDVANSFAIGSVLEVWKLT